MSVVDLRTVPTSGAVYRSAIGGIARRRPTTATLPGTTLRVTDVGVDLERLAAYDRICGFRLSNSLPATYPHVLAFPIAMHLMNSPDFPFGVIGLVHVGNTITVHRPISASTSIDFEVHAANLRPHDRGQQFDVIAIGSCDGAEVWRGVSTYLRRSAPTNPPDWPGAARSTAASTGGLAAAGADRSGAGCESVPTAIWSVGRDVGRAYAAVSGDRNPIHTSRLGARAFGFRGPIAHGMWSAARCLAALEGTLPDAYAFEVSFKHPIRLPSTVTFTESQSGVLALIGTESGEKHLLGSIQPL